MKIHRTINDEFSEYGREYIFDRKAEDRLQAYADEILARRAEASAIDARLESIRDEMEEEGADGPRHESLLAEAGAAEDDKMGKLLKLEQAYSELTEFLGTLPKARYDRYQLDDNIRNYLEITQTQLGEIEAEGGLSKGGLSRWEKNIMTSELPLSFLLAAAEEFGVTLPELLYGDPTRRTDDDDAIVQFLESLQRLTDSGEVRWREVAADGFGPGTFRFRAHEAPGGTGYESGFGYEGPFKADGPSYYAELPDSDDIVIIYSIDRAEGPSKKGMELYLHIGEKGEHPIYSTYAANGVIDYMLEGLYNVARRDSRVAPLGEDEKMAMARLTEYAKGVLGDGLSRKPKE